jgi:putative ubiquitin-RnfH superfamily antitoxin RatB of RatAB toxin-antitoxin module
MISIEICYATPGDQMIELIQVQEGCTLGEALKKSELSRFLTDVNSVGVFSKIQPMNYVLQANDRIEIYRPLTEDPMKKRRIRQHNNPLKKIPR